MQWVYNYFNFLGDCYRLKREFPNAERCFNEALLISPDHERTLERFGI